LFPWLRKKKQTENENHSPEVVSVTTSMPSIRRPCPPKTTSVSCTPTGSEEILEAQAKDPDNDTLLYTWSVTDGRLSGEGHQVTWDLSGVANGTYTATVEVNDGNQHTASGSTVVTVSDCTDCFQPPPPCPAVSVSCPSDVEANQPITFSASVSDDSSGVNWTYNWSVSAGIISKGQGTSTIIVDTKGLDGQSVTATVNIGGVDPSCTGTTVSCTTGVKARPPVLIPINGRVRLANKTVKNGQVVITSFAGQLFSVPTDQNGIFSISLPPGQYQVQVVSPSPSLPFSLQVNSSDANRTFSFDLLDATGSPSPSPQPSLSPPLYPTPTPSTTPTTTGTPATEKIVKESDRITVTLPQWFLKDVDNTVTLDLERVVGIVERLVTINKNTNTVTLIDKPKGLNGDLITPVDSGLYDTYVSVKLTGEGLIIPPDQVSQTKLYSKANQDPENKPKQTWTWDVRPAQGLLKTELTFEMFVTWQPINGEPAKDLVRVWGDTKTVPVGKSGWLVYGSTFTSPFALFAGAGLIRKRARKSRKTSAAELGDEVVSSVYAPREVRAGDDFLVDIFLQLADELSDIAEKMAKMGDEASTLRDMSPLATRIAAETTLTFGLTIPGMEIQNSAQSGTWQSKLLRVRFNVSVPRSFEPAKVIATVIIAAESVPIGHLSFTLNVVGPTAEPAKEETLKVKVKAYKQVFISYASPDRPEVLKRVQILKIFKISFFQDLLSLDPGDQFEKEIFESIDKCDAFLLFWSKAASESQWVEKEVLRAIKRKHGEWDAPPEIIPVIIEGPPPAKPPSSLSSIHFNDQLIYFINSVETRAGDRD
jgi:hypothetical protein